MRDLGIDGRMLLKSSLKTEDVKERIDNKDQSNFVLSIRQRIYFIGPNYLLNLEFLPCN